MSFRMRSGVTARAVQTDDKKNPEQKEFTPQINFQPIELKHTNGKYRYTPASKSSYKPTTQMPKDPDYYLGNKPTTQSKLSYDNEQIVYDKETGKWKIAKTGGEDY